jgi:hypothetical protein
MSFREGSDFVQFATHLYLDVFLSIENFRARYLDYRLALHEFVTRMSQLEVSVRKEKMGCCKGVRNETNLERVLAEDASPSTHHLLIASRKMEVVHLVLVELLVRRSSFRYCREVGTRRRRGIDGRE